MALPCFHYSKKGHGTLRHPAMSDPGLSTGVAGLWPRQWAMTFQASLPIVDDQDHSLGEISPHTWARDALDCSSRPSAMRLPSSVLCTRNQAERTACPKSPKCWESVLIRIHCRELSGMDRIGVLEYGGPSDCRRDTTPGPSVSLPLCDRRGYKHITQVPSARSPSHYHTSGATFKGQWIDSCWFGPLRGHLTC